MNRFQAHPWHGIETRPERESGLVNAFIEISPGHPSKFELDKPSGHLRLDRPQRYSSLPPALYGFIPQTYCAERVATRGRGGRGKLRGDGDPLDICVLSEIGFAHGNFFVHARPIGGLGLVDRGEVDDKIIAVLESDVTFGELRDLSDCPKGVVDRLEHYFLTYKQPPGLARRVTKITEVYGARMAEKIIRLSMEDYRAHYAPSAGGQ